MTNSFNNLKKGCWFENFITHCFISLAKTSKCIKNSDTL